MFEHIVVSGAEVVRVTLNRPPANALSDELMSELDLVCEQLAKDQPRVAILASSQKMFMAGADLAMINAGWDTMAARVRRFQEIATRWERLPCPTIALINGHALGAGCELSLACDWRIMAKNPGRIGLPEVQRGLLAAGGGLTRSARLIGRARALDLNMRGRMLGAEEALAIGLISDACEAEDLESRCQELVEELLSLPRLTLAAVKRCIVEGLELDLDGSLALEREQMMALGSTDDTREGVASFLEKREPKWVHH